MSGIEEIEYRVVKKDGNREAFQRQKLIAGLLTRVRETAGQHPAARSHRRSDRSGAAGPSRAGDDDGRDRRAVMQELKQLDQIAYVRFASVYRQFRDIGEFKRRSRRVAEVQGLSGRSDGRHPA